MFARLWQWVRGGEARAAEAPQVRSVPDIAVEHVADEPTFWDELAERFPPVGPVSAEAERSIIDLVLQVVQYATRKKLDPPVVPALVPRVLAIVNQPEVDLQRLTELIQQDLAISTKLLNVANSPLFKTGGEVKTVRHAIAHLGSEQVAQVAIGLACKSNLESGNAGTPFGMRWRRQFHHGMTCALTAAQLAGKQDRTAQEAAFLGGLFHDVGQAVALRALEAMIEKSGLALPEEAVIDEALSRIHAFPGDEFYQRWTLPEPLMELCARHHQIDEFEGAPRAFYLVTLASSFETLLAGSPAARRNALAEARLSAERLGLDDAGLRSAFAQTQMLGQRAELMFAS